MHANIEHLKDLLVTYRVSAVYAGMIVVMPLLDNVVTVMLQLYISSFFMCHRQLMFVSHHFQFQSLSRHIRIHIFQLQCRMFRNNPLFTQCAYPTE
jgi:hypothetical protein